MTRRQLTLFVSKADAVEIEHIRQRFNPVQQQLINSHVTLCREDEIENTGRVMSNLQQLRSFPLQVSFGPVKRFNNGQGVLLPAVGDNTSYHLLREHILAGLFLSIRTPEPHITLMHPRNSSCTDEIFSIIQNYSLPVQLTFHSISLIEQVNGGRWQTLSSFPL